MDRVLLTTWRIAKAIRSAIKLRDLLGHMTYTTDSITGVRDATSALACKAS